MFFIKLSGLGTYFATFHYYYSRRGYIIDACWKLIQIYDSRSQGIIFNTIIVGINSINNIINT